MEIKFDRVYVEDFERCVAFTKTRLSLYRKGEVDKATMELNIDEARRTYNKVYDKRMISIITRDELNQIEKELGMGVTK